MRITGEKNCEGIKMSKNNLGKKFDDLLGDFDIDENSIIEETRRVKIKQSSAQRWQNQDYKEKVSKKIKDTFSTDEMRAVQAKKAKPVTEETKEKLRQANLGLKHSKERVNKMKAKRKGQAVYHKCFKTPSGAFPSKKAATEWSLEKGVRNPAGKFDKWIKERPDEFYYISKEEYEKIKDDPKIEGLPWMENSKRLKKFRNDNE